MTDIINTPGKFELMSWEPMDINPTKSGHYVVGHRGKVFGTAYFNVGNVSGIGKGWSQVPSCRPTHWLNSSYDMDSAPSTIRLEPSPTSKTGYQFTKEKWKKMSMFRRIKYAITGGFWH